MQHYPVGIDREERRRALHLFCDPGPIPALRLVPAKECSVPDSSEFITRFVIKLGETEIKTYDHEGEARAWIDGWRYRGRGPRTEEPVIERHTYVLNGKQELPRDVTAE